MALVHLRKGDPAPSINPDRFTLFSFRFCPFCLRVRLTLSHHHIDHDVVYVDTSNKPDWYFNLHPEGKVPLLMIHGEKLIESDLIITYLDQLRGGADEAPLMNACGEDNFSKALELSGNFMRAQYPILFTPNMAEDNVVAFRKACSDVETALKGDFFAGAELTLADLALFPMVDCLEVTLGRIASLQEEDVKELPADASEWPRLSTYLEGMRNMPLVAEFREPSRILAKYAATKRAGQADAMVQ